MTREEYFNVLCNIKKIPKSLWEKTEWWINSSDKFVIMDNYPTDVSNIKDFIDYLFAMNYFS